ncbi:MAG: galactose-1-phosphate uridylyltransferase, partial [Negativicutes bacterium]|nr:galactose-1-phosphate uridylyltransferase [Negativicutes bacterium]
DQQHPEGIFHPHRQYHHLKKENIGLIEAMGLAILPGRLDSELVGLKRLMLSGDRQQAVAAAQADQQLEKHAAWLDGLFVRYGRFDAKTVDPVMRQAVADRFAELLGNS